MWLCFHSAIWGEMTRDSPRMLISLPFTFPSLKECGVKRSTNECAKVYLLSSHAIHHSIISKFGDISILLEVAKRVTQEPSKSAKVNPNVLLQDASRKAGQLVAKLRFNACHESPLPDS